MGNYNHKNMNQKSRTNLIAKLTDNYFKKLATFIDDPSDGDYSHEEHQFLDEEDEESWHDHEKYMNELENDRVQSEDSVVCEYCGEMSLSVGEVRKGYDKCQECAHAGENGRDLVGSQQPLDKSKVLKSVESILNSNIDASRKNRYILSILSSLK